MTAPLTFTLLADQPQAASQVSQWYFDQWCRDRGRYSRAFIDQQLAKASSRLGPPMVVLAHLDGELVGACELKRHEMASLPQYEFWLGGLYVAEAARGRGIGAALVEEIKRQGQLAGVRQLYLQTDDLSGGLYVRHGFKALHQADSKGVLVQVMMAELAAG